MGSLSLIERLGTLQRRSSSTDSALTSKTLLHLPIPVAGLGALVSGALLVLSFAPSGLWPVAPATLLLLYVLLQRRTPFHAALIGWTFGLGYFGFGVNWVYHSLYIFGGAAASFAVVLTALFVLIMSFFPSLVAWGFTRLQHGDEDAGSRLSAIFVFASLWMLSEMIRGTLMGGFPWILIGYSQTTGPLGSLAPVIGVYGIGFVLMLSTLSLLTIFRPVSTTSQFAGLGVFAGVILISLWANTASFTTPKQQAIGVRMTQANIAQTVKFDPDRLKRSVDEYLELSVENLPDSIKLIVWPETAIPTRFNRVESYMEPTISALEARDVDVLAGGFERAGQASYNAVRQLGGARQVYRKRHLVPFGEYVPLRGFIELFSKLIQIPGEDIARGEGPHVPLNVAGELVGVSICYEDAFGEEIRALLPSSTMLVNVSNDAWFGEAVAPHQHEQKARMRARELGRPLIRVTNTGISSAITHTGDIVGRIPQGQSGYLDVTVTPRTGATPYASSGNLPLQVGAVLLLVTVGIRRRKLFLTGS